MIKQQQQEESVIIICRLSTYKSMAYTQTIAGQYQASPRAPTYSKSPTIAYHYCYNLHPYIPVSLRQEILLQPVASQTHVSPSNLSAASDSLTF
jgi:hypothetical protein